jgi:hypothetical protein
MELLSAHGSFIQKMELWVQLSSSRVPHGLLSSLTGLNGPQSLVLELTVSSQLLMVPVITLVLIPSQPKTSGLTHLKQESLVLTLPGKFLLSSLPQQTKTIQKQCQVLLDLLSLIQVLKVNSRKPKLSRSIKLSWPWFMDNGKACMTATQATLLPTIKN